MAGRTLLMLLVAAALPCMAFGQTYDFYPSPSGDGVSWDNANNWWRYLLSEPDANDYQAYIPTQVTGAYMEIPTQGEVYIRDNASVTVGAGWHGATTIQVGGPYYENGYGGSFLPRNPSTLTLKNGSVMDSGGGDFNIGLYGGTLRMEAGSNITVMRMYPGNVSNPLTTPITTPAFGLVDQIGGTFKAMHRTMLGKGFANSTWLMKGGRSGFNFVHLGAGNVDDESLATVAGTGKFTMTGGYVYSREIVVGNAPLVAGCWGELNLLGGSWDFIGSNGHSTNQSGIVVQKGIVRVGKGFRQDWFCPFNDAWYKQAAAGKTIFELKNTTEFGYMSVDAAVQLDGEFDVVVTPGAAWTVGQKFAVLKSRNGTATATPAFLASYNSKANRLFNIAIEAVTGGNALVLTAIHRGGDANEDMVVNVGDLGILAGNWGRTARTWATGDFTGDGLVNVGDLGVLAGNWGWALSNGVGSMPVPEPASLVLLALGGLAMLRRRK